MQLYNIVAELGTPLDKVAPAALDAILDRLTGYHPAIGRGVFGQTEVTVSLPAETLRQAITTGLAVLADALPGHEITTFAAMTAAEFDRRAELDHVGTLISVSEAAAELGVSRQRVLQRIESGKLPAHRVGASYVLPRAAVLRDRRARLSDSPAQSAATG
ncbi:DNA binding domain, excisionase family [Mycobacteroides abscessus subsp. abscessus]|nr:DNA binding domain, excisionase family [Mycobacteroides abscessus subsp. abscessus]